MGTNTCDAPQILFILDLLELFAVSHNHSSVWHPNTQMSEWDEFDTITSANGVWLTDSHGRKMIDGVASMWCNVWGHSNQELVGAITRQASRLQHSSLFNVTHRQAETLATRLVGLSPGMYKVFYSDNGSAAIEIAIKMAIQYWSNQGVKSRTKIASLDGGYHGDTLGAMSVGYIPEFFGRFKRYVFKSIKLPAPSRRGPRATPPEEQAADCLRRIENYLSSRDDVAAVIIESGAQVAGGVHVYPQDFQMKLSRICKKNDVLLIVDEIATGFGRLGEMSVYSAQNSRPDIVTYGKMLTGGYLTMAATLATKEIYDSFLGRYADQKHLFHGHTYTGNTLAAAAANKNLTMYSKYNLIRRIKQTSAVFADYVDKFYSVELVGDIRYVGLLFGAELVSDRKSMKSICPPQSINRIIYEAGRKRGVYLRTLGNIVMVVPPLAITTDELAILLERTICTIKDAEPLLTASG